MGLIVQGLVNGDPVASSIERSAHYQHVIS